VLLEFSIFDPIHSSATPQQILQRLHTTIGAGDDNDDEGLLRTNTDELDDEEGDDDIEQTDGADEAVKDENLEKKKKRRRVARIKKRTKQRAYEFSGSSDVAGVLFLEVQKIVDLPPERNGVYA
jgi:phosphatidylserine decarboxylase